MTYRAGQRWGSCFSILNDLWCFRSVQTLFFLRATWSVHLDILFFFPWPPYSSFPLEFSSALTSSLSYLFSRSSARKTKQSTSERRRKEVNSDSFLRQSPNPGEVERCRNVTVSGLLHRFIAAVSD